MITNNMPLGELLIEVGAISRGQLEEALKLQQTERKPLGDILIGLGYVSEQQVMRALEYRFRIPFYDLSSMALSPDLSAMVSHETARRYTLVPIAVEDGKLTVAIADPMNFQALDDVRLQSKMEVRPVLAASSDIKSAIVRIYEQTQTDEAVEDLNKEYTLEEVELLSEEINENIDNAPVVRLVNLIINQAINSRASDVHIEPMEKNVRVRFRIDGELYEQLTITKPAHAAVVTRIKIMGDMDIAEKRLPQDGRVQTTFNGVGVDLRLSVLPTVNGEKVVIRILGGRGIALERKKLGFTEENSRRFDELLKSPHGIILVSGPTGSGKTTTLYTALTEINKPGINVITIEDPVEYRLDGVNQVQINPKAGLTFAAGLRSILRQDPDVIMVGEIRDSETAEIAVRASITGHLVLSTIHTNDAASTVSRLLDMGIQPFLVSASLVGVVAQRLVRRVCQSCRASYPANTAELRMLGLSQPHQLYKGLGCPACGGTGYKGRIAIHEILVMNRELREAVDMRATAEQIRRINAEHGGKTLRESCTELVLDGVTTMEELIKVTYQND